jgi:sarcosine oxidase
MKQDYEYIVVGLGGIGSGAAYWLARRAGAEVLGLEQFEIGHVRGASQDHSRIIRLSYHTPAYVRLAQQAYQAWAQLEADLGDKLLVRTGGIDFAPRDAVISMDSYANSLHACAIPFERLDAAEIMRRWPVFRLSDDIHGLYQADSGIVPAAKCNSAHLRLARAHGAVLRENAPVTEIRSVGGELEVIAGQTPYRCRRLILATDAWSNQMLAHFGMKLPLTVTQEQVTYFATPYLADFQPDRFPVWIWLNEPCFYGFPAYGEMATKAAQDAGGEEITLDTRTFEPNPKPLHRVQDFLAQYLPAALGPILYTKTCIYTMPPDRDFVIDALPGHPNAFIAIGAGHAFKFASLIGKILGDLAMDGTTPSDLEPFKFDRPILRMENPPKQFMV